MLSPTVARHSLYIALMLMVIVSAFLTAVGFGGKGAAQPILAIGSITTAVAIACFGALVLPEEQRRARRFEGLTLYLTFLIVSLIVVPVLQSANAAAAASSCLSNAKERALTVVMYASDFDERLPPAGKWQSVTEQSRLSQESMHCRNATAPINYAMNSSLSLFALNKLDEPADTVLLFEADAYLQNASGGAEWFVRRHNGAGSLAFADGHAKRANEYVATHARWKP